MKGRKVKEREREREGERSDGKYENAKWAGAESRG